MQDENIRAAFELRGHHSCVVVLNPRSGSGATFRLQCAVTGFPLTFWQLGHQVKYILLKVPV